MTKHYLLKQKIQNCKLDYGELIDLMFQAGGPIVKLRCWNLEAFSMALLVLVPVGGNSDRH